MNSETRSGNNSIIVGGAQHQEGVIDQGSDVSTVRDDAKLGRHKHSRRQKPCTRRGWIETSQGSNGGQDFESALQFELDD